MVVAAVSAASSYYPPASASGPVSVATALVALRANPRSRLSISDTAEAISANFDALSRVANNLTAVAVTDAQANPPGTITISASQYAKQATRLLSKFSNSGVVTVQGLAASRAAGAQADARVGSFTVADNSTELTSRLSALQGHAKLSAIEVTTPGTALALTATQYADLDAVLDKVTTGSFGVAVSNATAQQAVALQGDTRVRSLAVLDSASGIVAELDGLTSLGARLRSVRSSGSTVLQVSADQVQRNALVIGKLYRGHQLAVQGAELSEVSRLSTHSRVLSIEVEDSAAQVSANLARLAQLGNELTRIHITDVANPLSITSREYAAYASVLSRISADDPYRVTVREASTIEAQALVSDQKVDTIHVSDTAAAISGSLDALAANTKLGRIVQTGRAQSITLSATQLSGSNVLGKIDSQYTLSVTQVQAADALGLVNGNSRVASVSVSDTGASVLGKLEDLAMLGRRLSRITLSDPATPLGLTASRWAAQIGTLAKIQGGYGVALSGVSAQRAAALAEDPRVRSVAVTDTAAAVSAALDDLHDLGSTLTSVTISDPSTAVDLTGAQYATQATTLAKMGAGLTLKVRDAQASQAAALAQDAKVKQVTVLDTSANIASGLQSLQTAIAANADRTWSLRQFGPPTLMNLTAAQYAATGQARSAIAGPYLLGVSGVAAGDVAALAQDSRVVSIGVRDSGANLESAQGLASLAGLGARLTRIEQSDAGTALSLSASDWATHKTMLGKVVGGVRASLSAVAADQVAALAADWRVTGLAVRDAGSAISQNLAALQAAGPLLQSITKTDAGALSITMGQWRDNPGALSKLAAGTSLSVTGVGVADAQTMLSNDNAAVTTIEVLDTAARVSEGWAQLKDNTKLQAVRLSDPNTPVALSHARYAAGAALLGKFSDGVRLSLASVAAADVAAAAADARVTSLSVRDSAAGVVAQLDALTAAGRKVADISLTGSTALSLTHTQWSSHASTLGRIATPYSATVTEVPASRALAVASANGVTALTVRDTALQIGRNLDALQAIGPALSTITPSDNGTPTLTLTAAQVTGNAAALAKLGNAPHQLAVTGATVAQALSLASDSRVSSVSVADTSANLAQNLVALTGLAQLGTITQTGAIAPMSMTATAYAQNSATLAKFQNAYTVNLSGATVAGASALETDARVAGFAVSASTAQIGGALSTLNGLTKLTGLTVTQDDAVINVTQAQLDTLSTVLDHLRNASGAGYRLQVTGVSVAQAAAVASRSDVDTLALSTTSQALSEAWADLLPLGDRITSISLSDTTVPVALTQNQWLTQSANLARIQGNYSVAVTDVAAADAATVAGTARVSAVAVRDSAAAISAQFDTLAGLGSAVHEVQVADGEDIVITTAQSESAAGIALIAKIMGEHEIVLSDAPST